MALHLAVGDDAKSHLELATLVLTRRSSSSLCIGPLEEELGWRGYALPCLIDRLSSVPWRREEDRRGRVVPLAMPPVPRVKRLVRRALVYTPVACRASRRNERKTMSRQLRDKCP